MSDAWTAYWRGGAREGRSGCVPNAAGPLRDAQARFWRNFAASLPRRAHVLDLATGDGAVLAMLAQARPDLRFTGVDSAAALPAAQRDIELRPGIAMEALPFAGDGFDAVTSQFGVEYGHAPAVAGEVARVLRQGGRFAFLCHHAAGPLVGHNRERAGALAWAYRGSGWLDKAAALARARSVTDLPTPGGFADAVADARRRYPGQIVAAEFLEAVRLTLEGGRRAPPAHVLESLAELGRRAEGELARVDAMLKAALDEDGARALAGALQGAGLDIAGPAPVILPDDGRPFAWAIKGAR